MSAKGTKAAIFEKCPRTRTAAGLVLSVKHRVRGALRPNSAIAIGPTRAEREVHLRLLERQIQLLPVALPVRQ